MRSTTTPRGYPPGYAIERVFSGLLHPYEEIAWETADVEIPGSGFRQEAVEAPATWDETARRIAASKYLRGQLGSPERERSVRQLVDRVVETIRHHGQKLGHLGSADEAEVFAQELRALLIGQRAAFNSPVWFNCGTDSGRRPADPDALLEPDEPPVAPGEPAVGQSAACFILSVRDTMESITRWLATEMAIFRGGSGSGVSLSAIREDGSPLKAGGTASGPLSFMRAADSAAGSIKSGGTTRRAAKMVVLDADHPDVRTFIAAKAAEERKAYALGDAGYDLSLNGEAWSSIQFQNANNSVRVPDEFFAAVADGRTWQLRSRLDGRVVDELPARDLLRQIATAAWECGDPGLQYDGAIQRWHTVPAAGRVNATNPCSEFIHLDETACNLASLNLLAFLGADGTFDVAGFRQAVRVLITAQEVLVDPARYPTRRIGERSRRFRPLGLGYANLGALLMALGHPYDSEEGRAWAAALTALMHGAAMCRSAEMAAALGPYEGFGANREGHLKVAGMHRAAGRLLGAPTGARGNLAEVVGAAQQGLERAVALGQEHGYRNSQHTVLAPTGTIGFLMGVETTGCEPVYLLRVDKALVGGGWLTLRAQAFTRGLAMLGYGPEQVKAIATHVGERGTAEGAPGLRPEHLAVFDTADRPAEATRAIDPLGHVRMLGAVQPFLSGGISKTVNLPHQATVEDIEEVLLSAHRLGVKAVAVYRDGSKRTQPLGAKAAQGARRPCAGACPTTGPPSRTASARAARRATSPSACTRTGRPARSS